MQPGGQSGAFLTPAAMLRLVAGFSAAGSAGGGEAAAVRGAMAQQQQRQAAPPTQTSSVSSGSSDPSPQGVGSRSKAAASKSSGKSSSKPASSQDSHRDTLRRHLEDLKNVDERCIFITRRINKLGFRSRVPLEQHFARYGKVVQVLVAHSKVKPFQHSSSVPRTRPGNFGLIVMDSPEAVQQVLAEGVEQVVAGVQIQVQMFERPKDELLSEESDDKGQDAFDLQEVAAVAAAAGAPNDPAASGAYLQRDHTAKMWRYQSPSRTAGASSPAAQVDVSSQLTTVLQELSRIAVESDQLHYLTREQSMHTASLAQWAQQSLRTLEEQCQQKIEELSMASCGLTLPQMLSGGAIPPHVIASWQEGQAALAGELSNELQAALAEERAHENEAAAVEGSDGKDSSAKQAKWQPAVRKACKTRDPEGTQQQSRDTLRSHLTQLSKEDPKCIFIARRINKLGFRSREVLRAHFSHYGEVYKVLVAHSKVKPFRDSDGQLKTRPGGLGLVVMKNAAVVEKILAEGEEQLVAGHQIRVSGFEKPQVTYNHVAAGGSNSGSGISTAPGSNGSRCDSASSRGQEKSEDSEGGCEKSDDMDTGETAERAYAGSGSAGSADAGSGDAGSNDSWQSPKIKK